MSWPHLFTACTSILAFFSSAVIWSLFIVSCAALKGNRDLLVCFVLCSKKLKRRKKEVKSDFSRVKENKRTF